MTNASRAPVDLEAFARELQQHPSQRPDGRAAQGDPLAELARIVGQDDPFRALLAARDERRAGPGAQAAYGQTSHDQTSHDPGSHEPTHNPAAQRDWQGRTEPSFAPEGAPRATPADAFNQYLASVEQQPAGFDGDEAAEAGVYQERTLKRVRPRRRLVAVGAGLAVVAVSITGALTYKGLRHAGGGGGVPVIQADSSPLKVAPKVADGVEIPDQNRQIYEPKAKDSQIRIVNREEQPIDIAQAARTSQAGAVTPGNAPLDAFGEPRRVRTVAVKPDTPPPAPQRETQAEAAPPISPIPTMTLPEDPAPRARPVRQASATPQFPMPATPSAQAAAAAPVQPAATPAVQAAITPSVPPTRKAPQRVASVAPDAGIPAEPTTTAASAEPTVSQAPVGGFSVQLGVRSSARDAQAALREMQGKYSQLVGKPELIRQAEVNGKTIYRVRVGPLAKAEASSLCSNVQGAGGQCFVAKN